MTRSLAVVTYPVLSAEDFTWLQDIRRQHDEYRYHMIDPHFTLVFLSSGLEEATFTAHVRSIVQNVGRFEFAIRCAVLGEDRFSDSTPIFLIPDEGTSNIVKLHDQLYTGPLAGQLRLDTPYIPHIGVANFTDSRLAKRVVDKLNTGSFEVRGMVEAVEIIWVEDNTVGTVERVGLIYR